MRAYVLCPLGGTEVVLLDWCAPFFEMWSLCLRSETKATVNMHLMYATIYRNVVKVTTVSCRFRDLTWNWLQRDLISLRLEENKNKFKSVNPETMKKTTWLATFEYFTARPCSAQRRIRKSSSSVYLHEGRVCRELRLQARPAKELQSKKVVHLGGKVGSTQKHNNSAGLHVAACKGAVL